MRRHRLVLLVMFLTAALSFPALCRAETCLQGSGLWKQQQRTLPRFDHLVIQGGFTLKVRVSGKNLCTVSGDDNLLDQVLTRVEGTELLIAPKVPLQLKQPMVVTLDVAELSGVTAEGAHDIQIDQLLSPTFVLKLDGACHARLSGYASLLEVELTGASALEAENLDCRDATVTANGTTVAKLQVRERLDVLASGIADVLYRGEPELDEIILTGRARVAPLE